MKFLGFHNLYRDNMSSHAFFLLNINEKSYYYDSSQSSCKEYSYTLKESMEKYGRRTFNVTNNESLFFVNLSLSYIDKVLYIFKT